MIEPRKRPPVITGTTEKITTGCGTLYITINEDESGPCEVIARMGKSGGCSQSQMEAVGRLLSISLRSGLDIKKLATNLVGIRCESPAWDENGKVLSCSDAIGAALMKYKGADNE